MEQVLCNSNGAIIARMPKPTIDDDSVLIQVHYSMISVGTEIAPLRASIAAEDLPVLTVDKAKEYGQIASLYLGAALKDPAKAVRRIKQIGTSLIHEVMPKEKSEAPISYKSLTEITWERCDAISLEVAGGKLCLVSNQTEASYQAISELIPVSAGKTPIVRVSGEVLAGEISIGLLNGDKSNWLGSRNYDQGKFEDSLIFNADETQSLFIVFANCGANKESEIRIDSLSVEFAEPLDGGLPHSELEDQGWNVGYSASGKILSIGKNISGLAVGDLVACGGAGRANHAAFVSVPQNLVCRVPKGCDLKAAASMTMGAIALQGVRRAEPKLGEKICVIGFGLIGQLTMQMLRANGCEVIGHDLSQVRVDKAKSLGLKYGSSDLAEFKNLLRNVTEGHGADRTIITAAAKTDAIVNLAMEVTRAKGRVVIVGDVGLNVERPLFYRKEIDLLMSTSYGPGRYDKNYEEYGQDYPLSYVRWTMNRNMDAYLSLVSSQHIDVLGLIDRVVPLALAPEVYESLAKSAEPPLGVILRYPDCADNLEDQRKSDRKVIIRGHRKPVEQAVNYALVGAGAFGISMLVPQMQKRKDLFFLKGVVSRSTIQASNFARNNQIEVLATDIEEILRDESFGLAVIATRHCDHAKQVVQCINAGKDVFVEKPIALNWEELNEIKQAYCAKDVPPLIMVGFNRRFSPAIQVLSKVLQERTSPIMINYRLNGGYIAMDSWIQDQQGGGRNIGEACHMYDVFRFLSGSPVESISARSIDPNKLPYLRNDNFCATLSYQDGSVGNLVYTALGPKQGLPKERVEIFCDGEAYLVDDYKSLVRCSDGKILWSDVVVDKGHYQELSDFGEAIKRGGTSPISFDEIMETSAVSLRIEDLIFGRGDGDQSE